MKINRISEENKMPEWSFVNKETNKFADETAVSIENIEKISKMKDQITENEIISEKDTIEKCASSKTPYFYNSSWSESVKSELKEYAIACKMNMEQFKLVEPDKFSKKIAGVVPQMIRTASKLELSDPFKLDEKLSSSRDRISSRDKKGEWQPKIDKEAKLSDKPSMSGIVPVRGGEEVEKNSYSQVARGQNSITDPDAIGKLAGSDEEDNGAKFKRENEEKIASKKTKHEDWQREKIEAMEKKDILPNRHVFPTEVMNAQPGIKGEIFDFDSVPEKTQGEEIRASNIDRKRSIRGEEKAKHEFATSKNPVRTISEDFSSELSKFLKK